jgi:hypothetical protein
MLMRSPLPAPLDDPDAYARLARKRAWTSLYAGFLGRPQPRGRRQHRPAGPHQLLTGGRFDEGSVWRRIGQRVAASEFDWWWFLVSGRWLLSHWFLPLEARDRFRDFRILRILQVLHLAPYIRGAPHARYGAGRSGISAKYVRPPICTTSGPITYLRPAPSAFKLVPPPDRDLA